MEGLGEMGFASIDRNNNAVAYSRSSRRERSYYPELSILCSVEDDSSFSSSTTKRRKNGCSRPSRCFIAASETFEERGVTPPARGVGVWMCWLTLRPFRSAGLFVPICGLGTERRAGLARVLYCFRRSWDLLHGGFFLLEMIQNERRRCWLRIDGFSLRSDGCLDR